MWPMTSTFRSARVGFGREGVGGLELVKSCNERSEGAWEVTLSVLKITKE